MTREYPSIRERFYCARGVGASYDTVETRSSRQEAVEESRFRR